MHVEKWNQTKTYLGYIAITLAILIPLEAPQIYYSYVEYDSISSLLGFLPTFASFVILFNIFMMPCSWTLCFFAIPQMLPEDNLPFRKNTFAKVIIGLSLLFVILTIANLAVFYGITAPGLAPTLRASILSYLINANVRSSWNRATNLIECCGATGAPDFLQLGFTVAPCSQYGAGCADAIIANFTILWMWSLVGQSGAIFIGLNGVFKTKNEEDSQKKSFWQKIKSRFC